MTPPGPRKKVALVIGAGSVKCAASLGLQEVLVREGIGVDMVVGCSAGAIYAALIAMGRGAEESAAMTARLWTKEVTSQRDPFALFRAFFGGFLRRGRGGSFGLRKDALIMRRLRDAFGDMRIEDAKIPLYITATDLATGDQAVLDRGSVVDAIRASISLPYIFKPFRIGDRTLVDGFLSDPLPVNVAIREGAGLIVAMGFESPYQRRFDSFGRLSFQLSSIMTNNLLRSRFAMHSLSHHEEVILVAPEFGRRVRLFDTEKIPYVIEEGRKAAEAQVPYLRRILAAAG
ncbi:MAG TPA: patatin-like phospholipase family protein [Holophaga sp.]|nr:patatin-like phospholipase family protein [Holophaga sp.]